MLKNVFSFFLILFVFKSVNIFGQCNTIRPQIDITFNTDQDCAPVTVTDFTIKYFFNTAQNPGDIEIRFEWNDPGNTITLINIGNGLIASAGNTEFEASAPPFIYFDNSGQCTIRPTGYVYIAGVLCPTSEEEQTAFFWGTDQQANANLFINPVNYDVCYNNPITNAIFFDNSEFNCNILVEADNPNRLERHTQFVYGTNHDPTSTILNLSLEDGGTQPLTNGTGNLSTPSTRGTAGLPVTGGYFGPIENIPFPADGPASITFPMNAPADVSNLIGNDFEITLYNWNVCNPYNGDPLNPNYEDAIATTAYIVIIDSPKPNFITRRNDALGAIITTFCLDENIYFDNETPNIGGLDFYWEFFDDNTGLNLINTSTNNNPTFAYSTSGQKLIRLTASDPTAQGACSETYELLVDISPSLVAGIGLSDFTNTPIVPQFCQDASISQTFEVRFTDLSIGTATANSRWRWEFYDENGALIFEEPLAGAFSNTVLGPFDRNFINPGVYRTVFIIKDNVTLCESLAEEFVYVYTTPKSDFTATRVCEGESTAFLDNSTLTSINGEAIVSWEWDFNYDGVTFNKDPLYDNQTNFNRAYGATGSFDVALRVTTDQNSCNDLFVRTVVVDPLPTAQITPDVIDGCSILSVNFNNDFAGVQPDVIDQYIWEIDYGSGFLVDSIQSPSDPGFSSNYLRSFENNTVADITYDVRLRARTINNCEVVSNVVTITVFPGPLSGFNSINYSPFNDNCSPVDITFQIDAATQGQSPTDYTWTVADDTGLLTQQSSGIVPNFSYQFINNTQTIKDYLITLTTTLPGSCNRDSTLQIRVNPLPEASFNIDTLAVSCDAITFGFEADQKGLVKYEWAIKANGTTIFSSITLGDYFEYTFNKVAVQQNIEVTLNTVNFAGCSSNEAVESIIINPEQVINISFGVTPTNQTLPDATIFLNNNTNIGPWTYLWDFGDGKTSNDPNLTEYTYLNAGTYIVSLTASIDDCSETQVQSITINPIPPIVDFSYDPASGCAPLKVNFTNLSQFADPNSYEWSFGIGQGTSISVDPSYTYFEPGIYTVTLKASNGFGQTVTEVKTQIIEVFESPIAQFDVRPNIVYVPDNPIYTNNNSQNATSFLWDFGDGSTSTDAEPEHYYEEIGIYDIQLIASNSLGCTDTLLRVGIVEGQMNGRLLVPNAFSPSLSGSTGGDINNQSGINDVFLPLMQGVAEFEMFVFNRWGELLFHSTDKNIGWDGYYNGLLCPQDVYVYKLNLVFENGRESTRTGDINLMR